MIMERIMPLTSNADVMENMMIRLTKEYYHTLSSTQPRKTSLYITSSRSVK